VVQIIFFGTDSVQFESKQNIKQTVPADHFISLIHIYRTLHAMEDRTPLHHAMKIISQRGKADIYKSYQKQEKLLTLTKSKKNEKSGTSKNTAGNTETKVAPKKKAKEHDDSEDDSEGVESKEEEQGHKMTPVLKRFNVQVTAKPSYAPIQEMPTAQERKLEISIDDAIGTLRCVPYV
jgi:hypothetical protein